MTVLSGIIFRSHSAMYAIALTVGDGALCGMMNMANTGTPMAIFCSEPGKMI